MALKKKFNAARCIANAIPKPPTTVAPITIESMMCSCLMKRKLPAGRLIRGFAARYKMLSAMKTAVLLLSVLPLCSAQSYKPSESNLKARQWFQDSKFGLFIHWGVYSVLGDGEWVMNNRKMPIADYEPLAARFNPTEFDAAQWVSLAKAAGMKYIT